MRLIASIARDGATGMAAHQKALPGRGGIEILQYVQDVVVRGTLGEDCPPLVDFARLDLRQQLTDALVALRFGDAADGADAAAIRAALARAFNARRRQRYRLGVLRPWMEAALWSAEELAAEEESGRAAEWLDDACFAPLRLIRHIFSSEALPANDVPRWCLGDGVGGASDDEDDEGPGVLTELPDGSTVLVVEQVVFPNWLSRVPRIKVSAEAANRYVATVATAVGDERRKVARRQRTE